MPRRSAAARGMDGFRVTVRLKAPATLATRERELFNEVVGSVPDGFFSQEDSPLIAGYARALCQNELAAKALASGSTDSHWVRVATMSVRAMVQLATRLRLGPKGRDPTHRRHPSNARRQPDGVRPWDDNAMPDDGLGELRALEQSDAASVLAWNGVETIRNGRLPVDDQTRPAAESASAHAPTPTRDEESEASTKKKIDVETLIY